MKAARMGTQLFRKKTLQASGYYRECTDNDDDPGNRTTRREFHAYCRGGACQLRLSARRKNIDDDCLVSSSKKPSSCSRLNTARILPLCTAVTIKLSMALNIVVAKS